MKHSKNFKRYKGLIIVGILLFFIVFDIVFFIFEKLPNFVLLLPFMIGWLTERSSYYYQKIYNSVKNTENHDIIKYLKKREMLSIFINLENIYEKISIPNDYLFEIFERCILLKHFIWWTIFTCLVNFIILGLI